MLILASQSPQRKAILDTFGVTYTVVPADLDERAIQTGDPVTRCVELAKQKAMVVAQKHPDAYILSADTYVLMGEEMLEKPLSLDEARQMLRKQSGKQLVDHTGCCWYNPTDKSFFTQLVTTKFQMRELSDEAIERYVTNNPVTTWSGAFSAAYDAGVCLVATVDGSLTGFTHGLPAEWVAERLKEAELG